MSDQRDVELLFCMSRADFFNELTNLVDIDPFALLGISVSADEKRIARRYRQIAKQLHPDAIANAAQGMQVETAAQVIARIVNPSYQKLKHDKGRQEALSTLRLRVRRLVRTEKLVPTFQNAQQLAQTAAENVDIFYEQTLSQLAEGQFHSLDDLHAKSLEIGQLNLVFLHRKMEDLVIRPKRAGLMSAAVTPTALNPSLASLSANSGEADGSPEATALANPEIDYAQKHTARAKKYLAQQNYEQAVQELREALKILPQSAEIHSMIGQAYYRQKLSGMAKTHFRQALKLNPVHKVAQKYGKLLGLTDESGACVATEERCSEPKKTEENHKKAWLGGLLKR
jgi:curved DNA-binding protein CbpA